MMENANILFLEKKSGLKSQEAAWQILKIMSMMTLQAGATFINTWLAALAKPPLELRHGWVITSHRKLGMELLVHILLPDTMLAKDAPGAPFTDMD